MQPNNKINNDYNKYQKLSDDYEQNNINNLMNPATGNVVSTSIFIFYFCCKIICFIDFLWEQ